jgi:hypothetical protein
MKPIENLNELVARHRRFCDEHGFDWSVGEQVISATELRQLLVCSFESASLNWAFRVGLGSVVCLTILIFSSDRYTFIPLLLGLSVYVGAMYLDLLENMSLVRISKVRNPDEINPRADRICRST